MDVVGPCHQMKSGIWKGNGKSVDGQQREAERRDSNEEMPTSATISVRQSSISTCGFHEMLVES